ATWPGRACRWQSRPSRSTLRPLQSARLGRSTDAGLVLWSQLDGAIVPRHDPLLHRPAVLADLDGVVAVAIAPAARRFPADVVAESFVEAPGALVVLADFKADEVEAVHLRNAFDVAAERRANAA